DEKPTICMISVFKNAIQNIGEVFVFLKRAIMKLILLIKKTAINMYRIIFLLIVENSPID
ncbi:hypothetical protein, partial [Allobacillus sp. GCM10007490]|uniref:hypothetical protein n=1 Tax=Allobacillus sp. GCM10007490 TaxID=3317324 RepID=UPI0035F3421C